MLFIVFLLVRGEGPVYTAFAAGPHWGILFSSLWPHFAWLKQVPHHFERQSVAELDEVGYLANTSPKDALCVLRSLHCYDIAHFPELAASVG